MYAPIKLPIKTWAEDDRPREKLALKGRSTLSDAELIAILISTGNKKESAVDLAKRILLSVDHDLDKLSRVSIPDLKNFSGMGEAKALSIIAALELGRRRNAAPVVDNSSMKITSSASAYRIVRPELDDLPHEEFYILLLNRSNIVTKKEQVSRGGMNATVVDPKIVFKIAVTNGASGIILAHNHPSGETKPSDHDIRLTKKLKEAADVLDIALLDHIIVGANTYFSFADEGLV
jgi:DNA repair protein RadC